MYSKTVPLGTNTFREVQQSVQTRDPVMLKFFRTIRKKLIDQGNIQKYLLYAVGEILLVVIGILIALQVNNWNDDRKLVEKRVKLIQSIESDFETNRARLEVTVDFMGK